MTRVCYHPWLEWRLKCEWMAPVAIMFDVIKYYFDF